MTRPSDLNVIITSNPRSGISEIFGYVKQNHEHQFHEPLEITYEHNTPFEATRKRLPLLTGWNLVYNADPQLLLERGYDKIIYVSRPLLPLCEALALYFYQARCGSEIIELILKRPHFFRNIQKKWEVLEKEIDDPRYLRISLDDWNNFTLQTYNTLLDFLEFPKENRLQVVPVKFTEEERDFEGYSCSHIPKDAKICTQVEVIRNLD